MFLPEQITAFYNCIPHIHPHVANTLTVPQELWNYIYHTLKKYKTLSDNTVTLKGGIFAFILIDRQV